MTYRRKLIEVSLPLEAINKESAREKSIRHGHPSTLHLWWARRPLAACRAVLWSSLVDDPSEYMPDETSANEERERLFKILEDLVLWENINNEEVLDKARLEIARSVARDLNVDVPVGKEAIREFLATKAPPVLDPFAGGGSIPLEAQRLGLRAYASDLNPVAVLINKAMIEIPPKFAGMSPIHPTEIGDGKEKQKDLWDREWKGAQGLAEDVRYYGKWMRDEAFKRIGHLYPKAKITEEILAERPDLKAQGLKPGDELTVIAWLWARTVKCPNPACGAQMPLVRSFMLSTKKGKETQLKPVVKGNIVEFKIEVFKKEPLGSTVNRNGRNGRMNFQSIGLIAVNERDKVFLPPIEEHLLIAQNAKSIWQPEQELQGKTRVSVPLYGMNTFGDLFTSRQLSALSTFSDLVNDAHNVVLEHTLLTRTEEPQGYADAIATYLAFAVDYGANYWSTMATLGEGFIRGTFVRQALAMVWDFAEANPFGETSGNWSNGIDWIVRALNKLPQNPTTGVAKNYDATKGMSGLKKIIISTDPPYYDNIEYADLSDYFYAWMRHSLAYIYPEFFSTLLTPKSAELVASPWRFSNKQDAENFFESGLRTVFQHIRSATDLSYPVTIYYAFNLAENDEEQLDLIPNSSVASTGWETMLEGLTSNKFEIVGTWPMRTERQGRSIGLGANALASSIILVCRPRPAEAGSLTRREFLNALKKELPPALRQLQLGSIAPVDLAQAAIGPGMAVYSRYQAVLESDGSPMRVRTALALINQALDDYLSEQEGEYDGDTRWALAWYEQFGHNEAPYGVAETLSTAKNTSVHGLEEAGILVSRGGKVRLLKREELDLEWNPATDKRLTVWEAAQHLIQALDKDGEQAAGTLLSQLGALSETIRDLGYRLYTVCERKGWTQDALAYNMLVVAWPRLKELAARQEPGQGKLL
jgi:putative DNA methylase